MCWIKSLESIKMVKLENDSIVYLKENVNLINIQTANINNSNIKKGIELLKITVKLK